MARSEECSGRSTSFPSDTESSKYRECKYAFIQGESKLSEVGTSSRHFLTSRIVWKCLSLTELIDLLSRDHLAKDVRAQQDEFSSDGLEFPSRRRIALGLRNGFRCGAEEVLFATNQDAIAGGHR